MYYISFNWAIKYFVYLDDNIIAFVIDSIKQYFKGYKKYVIV